MGRNSIEYLSMVELGLLYCCIGDSIATIEDLQDRFGDDFPDLLKLMKKLAREVKQVMREIEGWG